jgi:folate-binding protein YgfZ
LPAPATTSPALASGALALSEARPSPCHASRSDLEVLEVRGVDATTFLQGQCTADVAGLAHGRWTWAGYCTPKGRLLSVFRIGRTEAGYTIEVPAGTAAPLVAKLRKFVLRAKVTLTLAPSLSECLWVNGADAAAGVTAALGLPVVQSGEFLALDGAAVFGLSDGRLVGHLDTAQAEAALAALEHVPRIDPSYSFLADIREGLPWLEAAVEDAFIPQMVDLDRIGGVSFSKGCYPGQEIVARTRYLGTVKRHLYVVALADAVPPGTEILSSDQHTGTVLRSGSVAGSDPIALAVIDGAAAESGGLRTATGPVTIMQRVHPDA